MNCIVCNKEFDSVRQDAKYCSSTCRSKQSRATDNPATDNSVSVATDNPTARFQVTPDFLQVFRTMTPQDCMDWLHEQGYTPSQTKPGQPGYMKDFEVCSTGLTGQDLLRWQGKYKEQVACN